MENYQKIKCSSCIAIEPHNFKILAFLLYVYYTPQLKNIAISAIVLTPQFQTFTNPLTGFFWVINPGHVDSTESAELMESAENYNYVSSLIKWPKNYFSPYSDTFSWILSVKNHPNLIFCQFHIFCCGPIPKNKNMEFVESFRMDRNWKWWIVVTVHSLIIWYYSLYTIQTTFQNNLCFIWTFFQTKNWQ